MYVDRLDHLVLTVKYVLVYGTAERLHTDPARLDATRRIAFFRTMHPNDIDDDAAIIAQLDADKRGVIASSPRRSSAGPKRSAAPPQLLADAKTSSCAEGESSPIRKGAHTHSQILP